MITKIIYNLPTNLLVDEDITNELIDSITVIPNSAIVKEAIDIINESLNGVVNTGGNAQFESEVFEQPIAI